MIYDFFLEVGHSIWKNGLSISALGTALFVLLRQKKVKKKLAKALPWLLSDDSEVKEYVSNQKRIESKINILLEERGLKWDAPYLETSRLQSGTTGQKNSLSPSWAERVHAHTTGGSTQLTGLFHSKTKEESIQTMSAYLKKLGSRKFQALLTSLVVNIASGALFVFGVLDIDEVINTWMPIINMTIGTISTWVYIIVEGGVDKAKAGGTSYDYTGLEAESKSAGVVESAGDSGYYRSAS